MPLQTGFQSFVNNELPLGVAGDFAGANIRATVAAPPFGYVAAGGGVLVGAFGWGNPATQIASNYYQPNSSLGFVHRENNALITSFLGIASMLIPQGLRVTLFNQGDFFGTFSGAATVGQKVYCDPVTGLLSANATGNGVTANSTAASLANTGVLTVGATLTGTLAPGQGVVATGIPAGSYIGSQLTGTTGSTGTYQLVNANGSIASGSWPVVSSTTVLFYGVFETPFQVASNVLASALFTASLAAPVAPGVGGILTITAIASGVPAANQFITATGGGGLAASANAQILYQLTGTAGSTGTYQTNYNGGAAVTSTNTFVGSAGTVGKISSWATSSLN
jgi:hypothetical protein